MKSTIKPRCGRGRGARLGLPLEFRVHWWQGTVRRVAISFEVQRETHECWDSMRCMRSGLFRRSCWNGYGIQALGAMARLVRGEIEKVRVVTLSKQLRVG